MKNAAAVRIGVGNILKRRRFLQIVDWGIVLAAAFMFGMAGAIAGSAQIVNLTPGDSINLSQLISPSSASVQVGDKLFSDFSFSYGDSSGNPANLLPASAISVTALSNPIGYGISFSGPFAAIGDITKDVVLRYSVAVTDPNRLISDIHLSYNGTVLGNGFSSVIEEVFDGGFGGQKLQQLEVLNPGNPDPVFQDLVTLIQPREKLFIQKDIIFGGGGPGDLNRALLSIIDQNFSQVPEPSTIVLVGVGCALLVLRNKIRGSS